MRCWPAIVALLVLCPTWTTAQSPSWQVDVAGVALAEAWDFNEGAESLAGLALGAQRRVWKALTVRAEGVVLHVEQAGDDGWLRGFTIGTRTRWGASRIKPFVHLGVGLSDATTPVPARGTRINFLALVGGGVQIPIRAQFLVDFGARWFHVSNNGREGRNRNPDIQALGAVIAIGWAY
jgi:hypothetical protein